MPSWPRGPSSPRYVRNSLSRSPEPHTLIAVSPFSSSPVSEFYARKDAEHARSGAFGSRMRMLSEVLDSNPHLVAPPTDADPAQTDERFRAFGYMVPAIISAVLDLYETRSVRLACPVRSASPAVAHVLASTRAAPRLALDFRRTEGRRVHDYTLTAHVAPEGAPPGAPSALVASQGPIVGFFLPGAHLACLARIEEVTSLRISRRRAQRSAEHSATVRAMTTTQTRRAPLVPYDRLPDAAMLTALPEPEDDVVAGSLRAYTRNS